MPNEQNKISIFPFQNKPLFEPKKILSITMKQRNSNAGKHKKQYYSHKLK